MIRSNWIVALLSYSIFFFWYTNFSGPLSQEEINLAIQRIEEDDLASKEDKENILKFMQEDDGGDFYMVNYLDFNENPPTLKHTGKGASAEDLMNYYMEYMYPEMFSRASHPVFFGAISANALDHIGAEETKKWDQVGIVRYRSIRDMLEISGNEVFNERHEYKVGALTKTIAVPVPSPLFFDLRIIILMLILILTLSLDLYRKK